MKLDAVPTLRRRVSDNVLSVPRSGIRDFFELVSSTSDVISLGVGEPAFVTPGHIRQASIQALQRGDTHYGVSEGLPRLREEVARYLSREFSVAYDPDSEILMTVGVSEGLDLALRALVRPGDEILFHEPCYVSNRPLITLAHGVPVAVETSAENGFVVTADDIQPRLSTRTRAILLNFPNNPTGAVLAVDQLRALAELAIHHDLVVVTDEIYAELRYDGAPVSIASFPGMKERTILLHGVSKAWAMTGFRLGFACAPAALLDPMKRIHRLTAWCAPVLSQYAALAALRDGAADVAEMKAEYRKRRDYVWAGFNQLGLSCIQPRGAFYAFPSIRRFGLTAQEFAIRLVQEQKVAAVPGTAFGSCGEGHIRCSYATGMAQLEMAMDRIRIFLKSL